MGSYLISRVISPLIWAIIIVTLIITPLITAHESPSRPCKNLGRPLGHLYLPNWAQEDLRLFFKGFQGPT